jgi:hypothetical protein
MTRNELIESLREAAGPDPALDQALLCLVGSDSQSIRDQSAVPAFTSSLDAAISLVPEDLNWHLYNDGDARIVLASGSEVVGISPLGSTAIAMCIAALKARSQS